MTQPQSIDEGMFPDLDDELDDEDGADLQTLTLYATQFPQLDLVRMGDLIKGNYLGRVTKIEGTGWKIKVHLDIHDVEVGNEADKAIRALVDKKEPDLSPGIDLDDDDEEADELEVEEDI